jgi:hypothetical protein
MCLDSEITLEEIASFDVEKAKKETERIINRGLKINKWRAAFNRLQNIHTNYAAWLDYYCTACGQNPNDCEGICDKILAGGESLQKVLTMLNKYAEMCGDFI